MADKSRPDDRRRAARRAKAKLLAKSISRADKADSLPSLDEMAEAALTEFGGLRNVFRLLFAEFNEAKEGSQTRQRILETIQRVLTARAKGAAPASELPEELDDEDVEAELLRLIGGDDEDEDDEDGGGEDGQEQAEGEPPTAAGS